MITRSGIVGRFVASYRFYGVKIPVIAVKLTHSLSLHMRNSECIFKVNPVSHK